MRIASRDRIAPELRSIRRQLGASLRRGRRRDTMDENPRSPTGHRSSAFDRRLQVRPALLE